MTTVAPAAFEVVETGETVVVGHPRVNRNRKPLPIVEVAGHRFVRFYQPSEHGSEPVFGAPCGGNCTEAFNGTAWAHHVLDGVCFTCNGSGLSTRKVGVKAVVAFVKSREARARRAARQAEERATAAAAARAAFEAEHANLVAALAPFAANPTPETALLADLGNRHTLSEAQVALAWKVLAEHAEAVEAEAARQAAQRYGGEVGSKVDVTGTVVVAATVETRYGLSALRVVEGTGADAGVTVKVFGTGATLWEVGRDDQVTVTGTVKAHETYQGTKQTVLTRARFAAA